MGTGEHVVSREATPRIHDQLRKLNRAAISDRAEVGRLLAEAQRRDAILRGPRSHRDNDSTGRLSWVSTKRIGIETNADDWAERQNLVLSFHLESVVYSFATTAVGQSGRAIEVEFPEILFLVDRRDRLRTPERRNAAAKLETEGGAWIEGRIVDRSEEGAAVLVRERGQVPGSRPFRIAFSPGPRVHSQWWASLRNSALLPDSAGWLRLGLRVSACPPHDPIPVERRERILAGGFLQRARRGRDAVRQVAAIARTRLRIRSQTDRRNRERVEVVQFANANGEVIRGIIDASRRNKGGVGVVVPSAWGRTKETLLPLARTIVETFEAENESVVVLRFDGIRRRGESHNEARRLGKDFQNLYFTVSQGIEDIQASAKYLQDTFGVEKLMLVTFSASAVEGRRALALDSGEDGRFSGWISVVGAPDLQSGMRAVSGGLDFFGGAEKGVKFGVQEIMGVLVDMDRTATDAIVHRLAFLEDAIRDFSSIEVPVVWVHGRHDAWLDLQRVRQVLGSGFAGNRRLLEVDSGHQLRSSREALEVFQLVATEIGRITTGRALRERMPDLQRLERRRVAERRRVGDADVDLRRFWEQYLLGRDGNGGIELMNATSDYQKFMRLQIEALGVRSGDRVLDVGAGVGSFAAELAMRAKQLKGVHVDSIDVVKPALKRASERAQQWSSEVVDCRFVVADCGSNEVSVPLAHESYDRLIASFFLSYMADPLRILREFRLLVRPGGRVVVSTMRRDADVSKLFVKGSQELEQKETSGSQVGLLDSKLRQFLNDAAKILELEDEGRFSFWDEAEFRRLAIRAGFVEVRSETSYGDPPQAVILSARRGH